MSQRNKDEVYYIDQDIKHLENKRERLTRDEITKKELEELLVQWKEVGLPIEHKVKLAPSTISLYVSHARQFVSLMKDDSIITKKDINDYCDVITKSNAPNTADNKFTAVSKFLVYCKLYDLKIKSVKIQSKNSIDNVITKDQYQRLLNATKRLIKKSSNKRLWEEMYITLRLIGMCGTRINERHLVTYENLHKGSIVRLHFKGKYKTIFINEKVRKELLDYAKKYEMFEGSMFILTADQIRYRIPLIVKEADIRVGKFNPHAFRHFFALTFIEQVGNPETLRQILGHSMFETTAIYLKQTNANVRDILNTLDFSKDKSEVANTDKGQLIKELEEKVHSYRNQWTKKAAIELFKEVIENF